MRIELASTSGLDLKGLEVYSLQPEDVDGEVVTLLNEAMKWAEGEMDTGWLLQQHAVGAVTIFAGLKDNVIVSIMATEFVAYPRKKVLHILAAAGKIRTFREFLPWIEYWAKLNGATSIDAWCRAPVARLFRAVGFRSVREMIRHELERSVQ